MLQSKEEWNLRPSSPFRYGISRLSRPSRTSRTSRPGPGLGVTVWAFCWSIWSIWIHFFDAVVATLIDVD